jgi:hypothetical protein
VTRRQSTLNFLRNLGLESLARQIYNRTWLPNAFAVDLYRFSKFDLPPIHGFPGVGPRSLEPRDHCAGALHPSKDIPSIP